MGPFIYYVSILFWFLNPLPLSLKPYFLYLKMIKFAIFQHFKTFWTPSTQHKHILWTENNNKLQFSNHPTSSYVIYEWYLGIQLEIFHRCWEYPCSLSCNREREICKKSMLIIFADIQLLADKVIYYVSTMDEKGGNMLNS